MWSFDEGSTIPGGREFNKKGNRFDVLGLVEDEEYVAEVAGQKDLFFRALISSCIASLQQEWLEASANDSGSWEDWTDMR